MGDIETNPSSMGPIFGAWIGAPKWAIRYWTNYMKGRFSLQMELYWWHLMSDIEIDPS